jgi:hypothetical protein
MTTEKKTEINSRLVIVITPTLKAKLKEMCAHYDSDMSHMIRYALNSFYNGDYRKSVAGYFGTVDGVKRRSVRAEKSNKVETLMNMSDDELWNLLLEVGYITPDEFHHTEGIAQGRQVFNSGHRIVTLPEPIAGHTRYYKQIQYEAGNPSNETYSALIFTIPELIRDLEKRKLI